ncbi:MAG: hypothetical protein AAF467_02290 [Actinomycetota bacterium]
MRWVTIGLGVLAAAAVAGAAAVVVENSRLRTGASVAESRWLAAVAISGDHSPSQSRLLAVEAVTRSPTAESRAALGRLLYSDPRTQPPVTELGHDGPVWATDVATTAPFVATGSDDGEVRVWSSAGELGWAGSTSGEIRSVDIAADDSRVATGSFDGDVVVWGRDGAQLAVVDHGAAVNDVALGADGTLVPSGGDDGRLLVIDASADVARIRAELSHPDAVWTVALSADSARAATGGPDGVARVWELGSGTETATYDIGEPVTVVAYAPSGDWLFIGGQRGAAVLVDIADGGESAPLEGTFRGGVVDIDWHPDGSEVAVVSLAGVNRYELGTADLVAEHRLAGGTRGVAYGPAGDWLVSGSGDFQFSFGAITFWDTAENVVLGTLNLGGPVETIAVDASGTVLAGFRSTEDLVETGGAWLVPGPGAWLDLACDGTDGVISEETWTTVTGETAPHTTGCG